MKGSHLMTGLLASALIFGAALWWFQTRAYYEELPEAETVTVAGEALPVTDFRGIDAATSPLKLRACFRAEARPEAPVAENPTPLTAPGWFDCFDAARIGEDLETGAATAYRAARGEFDGVDRMIALYPDGRGYMWRQLNETYAD